MDAEKVCSSCALKGSDLQKCAGCKSVWYCNVKCQKKDWKMHKSMCTAQGNKGKERSVKKERRETSGRACELCGKTGAKLFKCGACESVRYCGSVCQNTDWENHIKDCSVVKVYPEDTYVDKPEEIGMNSLKILIKENYLSGSVVTDFEENASETYMGMEMDMIVKVQIMLDSSDVMLKMFEPALLLVYNESREYNVYLRRSDKNKDFIIDKIIKEGWSSRIDAHPLQKKLYFKAHLNPDSSLDFYLNCTYNIQHW